MVGHLFYTTVEKHRDNITLPDFSEDIEDQIILELVEHNYSRTDVIHRGTILTNCTPIVQLYARSHGDDGLWVVDVAIQEQVPHHYVLWEVPAIPDSPLSLSSRLTVMDSRVSTSDLTEDEEDKDEDKESHDSDDL